MKDEPKILTRKEVAAIFKLNLRTLDYLVATNQIPFSRLGKRMVRFDKERLLQCFKDREGISYKFKAKKPFT
jgi:excisionase family DNA binding protein